MLNLEQFIETIETVPPELRRSLHLIKDLDATTKYMTRKIDENVKKYRATSEASQRLAIKAEIDRLFDKVLSLADDKLEQSSVTYQMVEKHIERLSKLHSKAGYEMPPDPNEPRYCICRDISYGEMIGCENPECITEWFHYSCVGITEAPSGKWYCPECLTKMPKDGRHIKRIKLEHERY